jgi:hypothetical protein
MFAWETVSERSKSGVNSRCMSFRLAAAASATALEVVDLSYVGL